MPNEQIFVPSSSTDHFLENSIFGEVNDDMGAGKTSVVTRGALRVVSVNLNQGLSISRAGLIMGGGFFGSGTFRIKIWGMKHTNVSTFNSGNPYGIYSKTSASVEVNSHNTDVDITGIVTEI